MSPSDEPERSSRRAIGYGPGLPRIVSLLPSTTEIACALGLRESLVGRSHECDFPAGIDALPALTSAKLAANRDSAAIDRDVRDLVEQGLSIYQVDAERLQQLAPDVILTQDHCAVCAASLADVEQALTRWLGTKPEVVSVSPSTLGDVWADLQRIARATGVPERGVALAAELAEALTEWAEQAQAQPARPSVACIEWIDPLMSAGNWMPELVRLAGGRPLLGEIGEHSPWLAWETLVAADPDVLLVVPCGFDLARTRDELGPLTAQPGFRELRAVRDRRTYLADGNAYFNRPGPRLVESLGILCTLLHPGAFGARAATKGWAPL
jgi:iron complex transport system substrate-binding protein